MSDPNVGPDVVLRQYVWALLKANDSTTWAESNYGGLVPIVPLSDEPELNDFDGPHIVYGYTNDTTGDHWMESSGTMTFAIYDDNFRRLGKTLNILQATFERADEAAHDVNRYLTQWTSTGLAGPGTKFGPLTGIRFGCIEIGFIEGGIPENTEGGRQSALFNIRFDYFHNYTVTTELTGLGQ